jgi:hypothetical protein
VKPLPAKGNVEGSVKERDLENRLAPEGSKITPKPASAPPLQLVTGVDADLAKDYQLQRALELLRSMHMIKQQGFSLR